jgi:hypothetical protein
MDLDMNTAPAPHHRDDNSRNRPEPSCRGPADNTSVAGLLDRPSDPERGNFSPARSD